MSKYSPRPQFKEFRHRNKRWACIVAHRRAGKTVACIRDLIGRAQRCKKESPLFAYVCPYREQAKLVAWSYLKRYAETLVVDPVNDIRESDLSVKLTNGAVIRLFGADNPNALRGAYLDGIVLDEFADMKPSLWGEVVRPMLSDRKGWAVFIGTPRGKNAFWDIYRQAKSDPDWLCLTLKASETGLLPPDELADARKTMTENQYDQEYECSFEAAILGAVYAKELRAAQDRIISVPYDSGYLVNCAFDLGRRDATAIWFYQLVGHDIRLIDFYEANFETASYYASVLKGRGYNYDTLYLPHDGDHEEAATGITWASVLRTAGYKVECLPRLPVKDGINAARMMFSRCQFDAVKCRPGLDALQAYQWGYNERMGEIKDTTEPVHNWASHAADAFRYLALAQTRSTQARLFAKPIKYPQRAYV